METHHIIAYVLRSTMLHSPESPTRDAGLRRTRQVSQTFPTVHIQKLGNAPRQPASLISIPDPDLDMIVAVRESFTCACVLHFRGEWPFPKRPVMGQGSVANSNAAMPLCRADTAQHSTAAAHAFPFDDVCCVPTSKVLPSSSALVRRYLTV